MIGRQLPPVGLLLILMSTAAAFSAAATTAPVLRNSKTAAECGDELRRDETALEAAGESRSAFFHRCWLHGEEGVPTPIQAAAAGAPRRKDVPSTAAAPERGAARQTHAERARRLAKRRSARVAAHRFRERDDVVVEATPSPPPVAADGAYAPLDPGLPNRVTLNVPQVGAISVPIVPVPGLAATVRDVVDHSPLPGLVTATP